MARNAEVHELRVVSKKLEENSKKLFCFDAIKNDDHIRFFTGLPTTGVFFWVTDLVVDKASSCHSSLTSNDHVLIVLMRLRLGLLNRDIAYRFGIPKSTPSKVFQDMATNFVSKFKKSHHMARPSNTKEKSTTILPQEL